MKTSSTQNPKPKKIQKLYNWMADRMPLGLSPSAQWKAYLVALIAAISDSVIRFSLYFDYCLGGLYIDDKRTILHSPNEPYVDMLPFWDIAKDSYYGFLIIALGLIWLAWYHYRYHYQKSKSIYLMKRLPAKNELRKRCLALPVAGAIVAAVTALLLTAIYYISYITMTPEAFL